MHVCLSFHHRPLIESKQTAEDKNRSKQTVEERPTIIFYLKSESIFIFDESKLLDFSLQAKNY